MSIFEQLANRDQVFEFLTPPVASPVDVRHGPILYMEDVSVSFDASRPSTTSTSPSTTATALHHRSQRGGGQNHHDGHHHR